MHALLLQKESLIQVQHELTTLDAVVAADKKVHLQSFRASSENYQ